LLDLNDFVNLEVLDCSNNQLTELKLGNCLQLRLINCSFNKLTTLDLTNLTKLEMIDCADNYLTELNYSSLNSAKLTYLNINNNSFHQQNLSCFSHLVNLEMLGISNNDVLRIKSSTYNH